MKKFLTTILYPALIDDKGKLSSARIAFMVAVLISATMSLAAINLTYRNALTWEYVTLTLCMWLVATLQKNWAKHVEALK